MIWQCNSKFKKDEKCNTLHLYEDRIKAEFLEAFNSLLKNKDENLQDYEPIIQALADTSRLDKKSAKLERESKVVAELLKKCIEENAYTYLNQAE